MRFQVPSLFGRELMAMAAVGQFSHSTDLATGADGDGDGWAGLPRRGFGKEDDESGASRSALVWLCCHVLVRRTVVVCGMHAKLLAQQSSTQPLTSEAHIRSSADRPTAPLLRITST